MGGKLKETGISHWSSPNTGATNTSGFAALPGGYRDWEVGTTHLRFLAWFWSATDNGLSNSRYLYNSYDGVDRTGCYRGDGLSVRCLQN